MQITRLEGFTASDDGLFRCLTRTLPDSTFVCITDSGGLDYPTATNFNVSVYPSEDAFSDNPSSCLASIGSWSNVCLDDAVWMAIERSAESI
jgi:hypothetical protein